MSTNNQKAFTLIELLVVIAIIGVLASIVLVNLRGSKDKAKLAKTLSFAQSVHNALGAYAVGYWNFNKGTGSIAYDSSGYGNNGTIMGGLTDRWTTSTPSGKGYAMSFDGVDDYVDAGNGGSLNVIDEITMSAWIYTSSSLSGQYFIQKGGDYGMSVWTNWNWGGGYYNQSGNWQGTSIQDTSLSNQWVYQVLTVKPDGLGNSVVSVYLNGALRKEWTGTGLMRDRISPLNIGRGTWGGTYFGGILDDVVIYTQALSTAQIQKLYAEGAAERGIALITDH